MNNIISTLASFLPDDIVFGGSFRRAKKILSTYNASRDKKDFVACFQQEKLNHILNLAKKASYYHYLNDGLPFEKIPFIDKAIILESFNGFVVNKQSSDYVTTGGTSGKPLGFYINKNRKGFEWFWMTNNWAKVGFISSDYRAVLTNHKLNGHKYRVNRLLKEYQYNNFSLNDKYLDFITDHINLKRIKFLRAYPSAAYILSKYIFKERKDTTLNYFLCGSENIFQYQKELIQNRLKIRMYTWYGHSEKLILAGEGRICENYHSNPFYGYGEIIKENGTIVNEPGAIGELTGTGFINTKMPFIRYKTGDLAEYIGDVCPNCGHIGLTFKNVQGRWKGDIIYKSEGSSIATTALNLHSDLYNYIKGLQYFQNQIGKLEVRIIPEHNFSKKIEVKILDELNSKAGEGLDIDLKLVESLEYSAINKYQILIQKIRKEQ
jgi:phenylacetate-CoA ligase